MPSFYSLNDEIDEQYIYKTVFYSPMESLHLIVQRMFKEMSFFIFKLYWTNF